MGLFSRLPQFLRFKPLDLSSMNVVIISLFPEEMERYFVKGLMAKGQDKGLFNFQFINLRGYADSPHNKVDDYPYSQKLGMLLKVDVVSRAIKSIAGYEKYRIIYPCPKGPMLDRSTSVELSKEEGLILIPGYYEGLDERVFEEFNVSRLSVADTILSSGENASLVIVESVLRLLPGMVQKGQCVDDDSIASGLLKYPQYTSPREFEGMEVPTLLCEGNHKVIDQWRRDQSLKLTLFKKPQLFHDVDLTDNDRSSVAKFLKEEDHG